jgi:integrase/recombinase XerD
MREKIEMNKKLSNKTFDQGYDEFINYCKVRNLRPATIKHYDDIINHIWYKFREHKTPFKDITSKTIDEFILFCKTEMNENDVTINTNIRTIRTVCYYFMKLGYMQEFKISEIKADREIIDTYTDSEIKLLIKKPDIKKCSYIEYRNYVICNFLLSTGCRAKTLVNLKLVDLDFENQLIKYSHTKNRRQQIVPMSNTLKVILIEYLQYRQAENENDYLFVNAYGNQLKTDLLSQSLCSYNRKRGVMKTGVHRWRHTMAKKYILLGGDIFKLQRILNHSTLDMVRNYVNMFTDDLKKGFNEINPLEQMVDKKEHIKMIKGGRK